LMLTKGVVERIIPSFVSSTAIIAAAITNEAFKMCTNATNSTLNNCLFYFGEQGIYTCLHEFDDPKYGCIACGDTISIYEIDPTATLQSLLANLAADPNFKLQKPSLRCGSTNLYMRGILESTTLSNLSLSLPELGLEEGDVIAITDPSIPGNLNIQVKYL